MLFKWIFNFLNFYYSKPPRDLDSRTTITLNGEEIEVRAEDLEVLAELGKGAFGIVEKMKHRPSNTVMAVKVMVIFLVI